VAVVLAQVVQQLELVLMPHQIQVAVVVALLVHQPLTEQVVLAEKV
jgi:hypothetical protein